MIKREFEFDVPMGSVRGRVTRGALLSGIAQAVRIATQTGSVIILSRLLDPSEFGIYAMAAPILAFAAMFQDLGLSQATVQKDRLTHDEVNYLFWIGLLASICVAAALVFLAPLVATFYGNSKLAVLTASMGTIVILSGLSVQHVSLLNRRMQFGVLAILDSASAVVGLIVSCVFALVYHSYWAIFAGVLSSGLVSAVGPWLCVTWRPSAARRNPGAWNLLHFGAGITGFNLANFFARNLDNVLIGRFWGELPLGLYDRAYKLLLLPVQQVTNPLARVMLPVLSRLMDEPSKYRDVFLRTMGQVLLLTLPGIAFMIATADVLVPVLLGKQWSDAAPIFSALGFAGLVQVLNNPGGWLLMSQSRTQTFMWCGIFGAVSATIAFVIGLPYGPVGVAVAYAINEILRTPILWWIIGRKGPVGWRDVASMATPHLLGAVMSLCLVWVGRQLVSDDAAFQLIFSLFVSYAVSGGIAFCFPGSRRSMLDALSLSRNMLKRRPQLTL